MFHEPFLKNLLGNKVHTTKVTVKNTELLIVLSLSED